MKIFYALVVTLCVAEVWCIPQIIGKSRFSQPRRQADEEPAAPEAPPPPAPAALPPAPRPAASAPVGSRASVATGTAYALPDGSELIVGPLKTTFSCDGRIYGYYADPDNNCQVFHVCVHHLDVENGLDQTIQYSFFCGNQTVFDQETLVCTYPDDAVPCNEAGSHYDAVNSKFGITDRPSRRREAGEAPEETKEKSTTDEEVPATPAKDTTR